MQLEKRARDALEKGYLTNARLLFREVVARNPKNVRAWRALMDLEEDVEARLQACERVIALDVLATDARERREVLREQVARIRERKAQWAAGQVAQARALMQEGERGSARKIVRAVVDTYPDSLDAWLLLAELSVDLDERVHALQEAVRCKPDDHHAQVLLARWQFLQTHPLKLAEVYEEEGQWMRALEIYRRQAAQVRTPGEWGRVYRRILRLESKRLEAEQTSTWLGSTWAAVLIAVVGYLILVSLLWEGGMPLVAQEIAGGTFCVSLGVGLLAWIARRSRSALWQTLFGVQRGARYSLMLIAGAVLGWLLWLVPVVMLLWRAFRYFSKQGV